MHNLKELIKEVLLTNSIKPDCGCGCKGTAKCFDAPILNENLQARIVVTENMQYHIDAKKPLIENTFRYGSKAFLDLWAEARYLYSRNALNVGDVDKEIITETHLGEYGMYEGKKVPLDLPMLDEEVIEEKGACWKGYKQIGMKEKDGKQVPNCVPINEAEYQGKKVEIGKPKRGGASGKKYYVYVKDKGKVKKVSFGDSGGLREKINDPKARQAFAKRHKCAQKKDKTKASYWSCRLPRYAKSLGLKTSFTGYW